MTTTEAPIRRADHTAAVDEPGPPKAIVIGAGFGGMAAALRLRKKGYQVTVVDRCERLGGRGQVFERDGFRFDAGPTVITAPYLFEELFQLFGERLADHVAMQPVEPWYRFRFADGRTFDYGGTVEDTLAEIRRFNPADCEGYLRLLNASEKIFKVGYTELADQPFHRLATMLRTIPDLLRLKSYKSVYGLVASYLKDPSLRMAFSMQPLLVGGNPFDTTSIYSLIHYLEREWGIHFPVGGTGALVDGLGDLMRRQGIEVRLNTTVDGVLAERGVARGVRLESGEEIHSDLVVSNADAPFLYKRMVPGRKRRWWPWRVKRLRYSMGLFVLYFGTKTRYPDVAHHTILMGPRYKDLLRDIFHRKVLAEDFSLYLHRPTASDPSLAPDGCDGFYVLSPVPNLQGDVDWGIEAESYGDRILEALDKTVLPGVRDNLAVRFHMTPPDFKQDYLTEHGTGFSIQPTLPQSAWFRFHNRSEELQNLFLVGASTHPGAGLPGVLSSAKVVDNLVPTAMEWSRGR